MRRQIQKLILGNGFAQALQFLSILVLSRVYLPSDFGLLAQVQSIAMVVAILATLQLHLTIPLSKSAEEARVSVENVQALCLIIFFIILLPALYAGAVATYAIMLALFLGLANTYNSYLVFNGSFGRLSGFYVVRAILIISLQIGFAFSPVENGLVLGTIIAEGLAAVYLRLTQVGALILPSLIRIRAAIDMVSRVQSFSLYGTLQEIVSVSAFYAPLILFTKFFDDATGGQYAMANRLVWAPVVLLSSSVGQVLYHRLGKSTTQINAAILGELSPSRGVLVFLITGCSLSFYFKDYFLYVIGANWGLACQLLPLQILWGCLFLIATPYRIMYRVLHMQKYQLAVDAGMLIATTLIFVFSSMTPLHTMWSIIFIALVQNVYIVAIIRKKLKTFPVGEIL